MVITPILRIAGLNFRDILRDICNFIF